MQKARSDDWYEKTTERLLDDPRYGAARLWIDAIIDPASTRDALITALDIATRNRETTRLETGVFQV